MNVRRWRWTVEAAALVATYTGYTLVRNELGSARVGYETAAAHARAVLDLERALRVDVEAALQHLVLGAGWLVRAAGAYYRWPHLWVVVAMLVALAVRRPDRYPALRWALVVTTLAALVGFASWPLAPPRLLPELGFVDTVRLAPERWAAPPPVRHWRFGAMATNQFAAMPSLHVAYATWVAIAARSAFGRRVRALATCHFALTWIAVVVTANHWTLDGVAGSALACGAWTAVRAAAALSPRWRARPLPAPAR